MRMNDTGLVLLLSLSLSLSLAFSVVAREEKYRISQEKETKRDQCQTKLEKKTICALGPPLIRVLENDRFEPVLETSSEAAPSIVPSSSISAY